MVGTAGMVADTFVQVGQAVTTMAALLDPDAVTSSVKAMAQAAKDAGATLVAITAFARSPLAAMADISLVAGMGDLSFREEVTVTSRIPQTILMAGLIAALSEELAEVATAAKALALEVISGNLDE